MICTVQPSAPETLDAHQPVAELLDDRLDDRGDAGGQARLDDEPRFAPRRGGGRGPHRVCNVWLSAILVTKKSGPRGTHSQNPIRL